MRLIDADELELDAEYDDGEYWAYSRTQIENAPTIEPKKQKIAYLVNPNPYGECSECGQLIDSRDGFNFCPNCGARIER